MAHSSQKEIRTIENKEKGNETLCREEIFSLPTKLD
jgi:hypothetical protein